MNSVTLKGPYNTVTASQTIATGNWVYDKLSGNTYNTTITVTVPPGTPADRYELVLGTSSGNESSTGAVKVIKDYKAEYYIVHMSDAHRWQGGYDGVHLLRKVSAILKIANIMDPEIIFETGDNMYNVRNHPDREVSYFHGLPAEGIIGMHGASAATFMVAGNHDSPNNDYTKDANVAETANFFNTYYGLHIYNFTYGNGRFIAHNDAWGGGAVNTARQGTDAAAWLSSVGRGNFVLAAAHCMDATVLPLYRAVQMDLALLGHNHTVAAENPRLLDGKAVQYVADAVREPTKLEFNLFKVNNSTGAYTPVCGPTARCQVLRGVSQAVIADPALWIPNLQLTYAKANDGSSPGNTATIVNDYGFAIDNARVRFVMPKGSTYEVSAGTIGQQFDGTSYRIVDVSVDVPAKSSQTVTIAVP